MIKRFLVGLAILVAAFMSIGDVSASLTAGKLTSGVTATLTEALDAGQRTFIIGTDGSYSLTIADGSGVNQANKVFVDHAITTTTYDLDSSLTCPLATCSFTRIVAVRIVAASTNSTTPLAVGGDFIRTKYLTAGGDTLANVTIPVHRGGMWEFVAPDATGVAITATTGDELTVTVNGSDAYDIVVIGS